MSTTLLVLYPHRDRFYPQHDVYGRLPGYHCTFSAPDETFSRHSRTGMDFQVHRSQPIVGVSPNGAGQLEHTRILDLDRLLRRVEPKLVITFEAFSAASAQVSRARRRHRFRHVVLSDSTAPPARSLWRYAPTTAFFAAEVRRTADRFIAHTLRASEALRLLDIPSGRVVLVPPGVELPPIPDSAPASADAFRVSFLGALRQNKGVLTLIRAFREVSRRDSRSQLSIAGRGPLGPAVAEAARKIRGIRALGRVDEQEKWELLRATDLFVVPSEDDNILGLSRWEEQTAISAIEAMQSGAPTVGSNSGALPEIIGRPDAVFGQRSASVLTGVIERARDDPGWRAGLRGAEAARARVVYDIRLAARTLTETFDALLNER